MRHRAADLLAFATALLRAGGLAADRAAMVAEVLLEADLLGHTTHGLDMLAAYLKEIDAGSMATVGEPEVLRDEGAAQTWDGKYLPGPWLVKRAIAAATRTLDQHPVAVMAIRRSHHIGCLQAYLKAVTDQGRVIVLTCSDPSGAGVTPHGGVASRITPNPLAAGFPTGGDPVLMDISMSTTTNAMTRRAFEAGERLPGPWLVDAGGRLSDDPAVLFGEKPGAVLPLGGLDLGHKGFALALLVEALTSGLAGHGRADQPKQWGASVFLMLIDPGRFGGRDAFVRETTRLAEVCRTTPVAVGAPPVRLPGSAALARRARQLEKGVTLHPTVLARLAPWADRLRVPMPAAV
jgi:LDH2 family malate/lactate/ureidoglycolate dehydrogenase